MKDREQDFDDVPWAQQLINDPDWERIPLGPDTPGYDILLNRFWAESLRSSDTLRLFAGFIRSKTFTQTKAGSSSPDLQILLSLGLGATGANGILHGGVGATALDMVTGYCTYLKTGTVRVSTAKLTVNYKAPCPVPSIVLCKAWLEKNEGRRYWLAGSMEDGMGKVYATTEAVFVKLRSNI